MISVPAGPGRLAPAADRSGPGRGWFACLSFCGRARESLFPAVLTSGDSVWSPAASCRRSRRTPKRACNRDPWTRLLGSFSSVSSRLAYGWCVGHARTRCLIQQHDISICRYFLTGATGLEPATSGVTGRFGATGYSRLRAGITGYSRHFLAGRTGCDRLRSAAARHSLCGRCVVGLVPTSTTAPL